MKYTKIAYVNVIELVKYLININDANNYLYSAHKFLLSEKKQKK